MQPFREHLRKRCIICASPWEGWLSIQVLLERPVAHVTDWERVTLTHMPRGERGRVQTSAGVCCSVWLDRFCSERSPRVGFDLIPQHHDYNNKYQPCLGALSHEACTLWHFIIRKSELSPGTFITPGDGRGQAMLSFKNSPHKTELNWWSYLIRLLALLDRTRTVDVVGSWAGD